MNKTDIIYSCCYRFVYQLNLKRLDYVFSPFLANIMLTRTERVSVREKAGWGSEGTLALSRLHLARISALKPRISWRIATDADRAAC